MSNIAKKREKYFVFLLCSLYLVISSALLSAEESKKDSSSLPEPQPVIHDIFPKTSFSVSPDGKRIAVSMIKEGREVFLYIFDLQTREYRRITNIPAEHPSWSPEGRRIVFSSFNMENFTSKIYIINADGSGLQDTPQEGYQPSWSPLGNLIALTLQHNIWTMNVDGSNLKFLTMEGYNESPSWSPDGKKLVFSSDGSIAVVSVKTGFITDVFQEKAWCGYPVFSPSGERIAFVSNRGGEYDIWSVDLEGKNLTRITQDQAREFSLQWRPDGYIYYLREEKHITTIWKVKAE